LTGLLALRGSAVAAQPPQEEPMTNLQVIPKETPRRVVVGMMREFTFALGVRCEHCHVDEHEGPNYRDDKASDEKAPKRKAREMLRMTQRINAELLAAVPERSTPPVEVRCVTCHHGLTVPETLADRLGATLEKAGVDSTRTAYRQLRADGLRGRYDFGETSLNEFARHLSRTGRADEALAFLDLNAEYYPESRQIPQLKVEVLLAKGDRNAALELLRKVVAADPADQRAARRLKELEAEAPASK
jgi:hypothetical protein